MAKIYAGMFGALRGPAVPPTPRPPMSSPAAHSLVNRSFGFSSSSERHSGGQYSHIDGALYENLVSRDSDYSPQC